jgi:NTP pyrophosphatase (non-canonical NTP hydrolase)
MSDWTTRVIKWADDRKILSGSTPAKQLEKLKEELGELCDAIDGNDGGEIVDAIGDMSVVLCIIAEMYGSDFTDCQEAAWEQIKDRRGEMRNGVFVKEENL